MTTIAPTHVLVDKLSFQRLSQLLMRIAHFIQGLDFQTDRSLCMMDVNIRPLAFVTLKLPRNPKRVPAACLLKPRREPRLQLFSSIPRSNNTLSLNRPDSTLSFMASRRARTTSNNSASDRSSRQYTSPKRGMSLGSRSTSRAAPSEAWLRRRAWRPTSSGRSLALTASRRRLS